MKSLLRRMLWWYVQHFGSKIRDPNSHEIIGRALLIPWRGRIIYIGTTGTVVPVFLPQERLTYWKQELAFRKPDAVDFPHEPRS